MIMFDPSDLLAELLTLTVTVEQGDTVYRNHEGKKHRLHGPAVISPEGYEFWYLNGQRHRDIFPAIIMPGLIAWYQTGELHRGDGPAEIQSNGLCRWYINGQRFSKEEFHERVKSV